MSSLSIMRTCIMGYINHGYMPSWIYASWIHNTWIHHYRHMHHKYMHQRFMHRRSMHHRFMHHRYMHQCNDTCIIDVEVDKEVLVNFAIGTKDEVKQARRADGPITLVISGISDRFGLDWHASLWQYNNIKEHSKVCFSCTSQWSKSCSYALADDEVVGQNPMWNMQSVKLRFIQIFLPSLQNFEQE